MADDSSGIIRRLFGKKKAASNDTPVKPSRLVEAVVETLARALRAYHDDAIDLEKPDADKRLQQIQRWAEDVLELAFDATNTASAEEAAAIAARAPNWSEIQRTFAKHRRAERRYVDDTVSGLRKAIVEVAEGLNRALDGDRDADERVGETMDDLRSLAEAPTTDVVTLRRRVMQAVEVVEKAAMSRATRHKEEIGRLNDTLRRMRIELRRANRRAETDPLTGLANRATFDTHLVGAVELYTLRASPASLLIIDLDHFKRLNDGFGHRAGDAALRAVAKSLKSVTNDSDLVARYGGEEFAVVLHDCNQADALRVAEKIRRRIQALVVEHDGLELTMTASIGVAQRGMNETPETWIERADKALYAAKSDGRDQVRAAA